MLFGSDSLIVIHFDGSYRKGSASYGYVISYDGKKIASSAGICEEATTNNAAEYEGLLMALRWLTTNCKESDNIVIKGDSALVIKQLTGEYGIKSQTSKRYVPEIRELLRGKNVKFVWVPRMRNGEADALSRSSHNL
jgi:ribonuclease HI